MAGSVTEFWRLVEQSRLLAAEQCYHLDREFQATNGSTDHSNPAELAQWLVGRNIFSRYQVTVLLAGRPGPFVYGDYKIYDRVEAGRLAGEFRAVHSGTGHPVLLRFLSGPTVQDPHLWTAAATEAQIACSLAHPNLQRFHELVDLGPFKFLVEEDLHGETLAERLAVGRMPPMEACRIARHVAQGLAAIHATGRAHGDVRPPNVWLELGTPQHPEDVKVLRDPLLPPAPPNFAAEDAQGVLLARSDYLAPEFQAPGKMPDVLTDLYALGCTLYHMLAGHPPFPGGSAMQKMARHAGEAIRPLEMYGVPQPIAQLVMYLMAKNPSLRYQDAKTVADQLAAFIDAAIASLPSHAPLPTLPAYEAAVRQSQARLASQSVATTFGFGPPAPSPEPVASAPAIRTAEVQGNPPSSIPVGKAVAPAPSAAVITTKDSPAKPFEVKSEDPKILAAKEAQQRKKLIITLLSVGTALIVLLVLINMYGGVGSADVSENPEDNQTRVDDVPEIDETIGVQSDINDDEPESKLPAVAPSESPREKSPSDAGPSSAVDSGPAYEVVSDDGKLPWASPTSGKPIELKYVPPVSGANIVVRPTDLLASPEGPRVLQALGPKFEAIRTAWENAAGVKLEDCEQIIVSLHGNDSQYPKVSVVARLKEPLEPSELLGKWGNPPEEKTEGGSYYTAKGWSYYIPAEEKGAVFLMASADQVQDVIKQPLPLLKREAEQVRRTTDADRHVTVLFDPTFVFSGDGDPLFAGDFARVKDPLKQLLGEGLQVGAASFHVGDSFYAELRVQTKVDTRTAELAEDFRKRLGDVPPTLKRYLINDLDPHQYWRGLAFDFHNMVEMLHEYTRVGAEGNQAVINAVLPAAAGHNLVLGTELTIATAPGAASVATTGAPTVPKTLDEILKLKVKSYSFDQKTFEDAVKDIEAEGRDLSKGSPVEFAIRIIGEDIESDGITRNKSLAGFNEENKTLAEVITALCMKNNPVPNVKTPDELDQKLIWVIGEDPDDKKQKVIITNRTGAEKRGYMLTAPFKPK